MRRIFYEERDWILFVCSSQVQDNNYFRCCLPIYLKIALHDQQLEPLYHADVDCCRDDVFDDEERDTEKQVGTHVFQKAKERERG